MSYPVHTVTGFEQLDMYILRVEFEDGTEQVIDFETVLHGELFGQLKDPDLFARVWLNPEIGTLVWPNGSDFDPYTLHEWPRLGESLAERARTWERVPGD